MLAHKQNGEVLSASAGRPVRHVFVAYGNT